MSTDRDRAKPDDAEWRLGEILIQNGWITWEQLAEALTIQVKKKEENLQKKFDSKKGDEPEAKKLQLGEILVKEKLLTWEQLSAALAVQGSTRQMLGEILIEKQLVTQKDLYRALAIQLNMVFVDFDAVHIPKAVIDMIPKDVAFQHKVVPLVSKNNMLLIAISDPNDPWPQSELAKLKNLEGYEIKTALASAEEIARALKQYYGL